jgi:hypothetical protein
MLMPNRNPDIDPSTLNQLTEVRHALLRLHKALLDGQRVKYEKVHGRVSSPGELLKIVIQNPEFDWLHRLSELVVAIDEAMEDKETLLTTEAAKTFLKQVAALLTPDEAGEVFGRNYYAALQEDPAAGGIHGEIRKMLGA